MEERGGERKTEREREAESKAERAQFTRWIVRKLGADNQASQESSFPE